MEVVLNESFQAFVRESFPDKSEAVTKLFQEVVNDRATITRLNISDLKARAVDEIKSEFVTKDFVRAEIAEVRQEIAEVRQEIGEVKAELKAEVAEVKVDILKWVLGMQVATITIILAGMKFLLS